MAQITHFKREWLNDVKFINKPVTKVKLQVTSNVSEKNRILATEPGKSDKYIVNLKAIAPDQLPLLKELFKDPNVKEVPIEKTNGLFLTGSIFMNDPEETPYLPMRNEWIHANIDYVDNKEKTAKLLRVTNIQTLPPTEADDLDLEALLSDTTTEAVMTESGRGKEVVQDGSPRRGKGRE
jgi:hypothetical protein